ncbi:PilZ domain-containing protein [Butyrivibrio sp. AD3002]|uniref:PilZ domain-containing protein n=1 Tax=Butyrivibrio sp. AD3002 TaxID=1280670 RepID=UPI0009DC262A|nr:PilZ domain-containing protein [Butyrivibrio sp. AD3002]
MKLSDVMKDSKIKIHATINGHGILLITKAEVGVRDGLLVDSLTYFDEDLTFAEPSKVVAVNKRDGRSYEFTSSRIGPVETRYGKFHLIRCTEDGKIINRRQAERYDIDRLGVIRIGDSKDIRNALVYDISMKGIAFILDTNTTAKVGDHIIASFRYDPNYFHFYACEATVVRVFTLNGQPAVGCTLDAMGADLVTLISSKKKEKLGIGVDDILGIADSPDEKIASGDKIPVNYVPQLAVSEEYERQKHANKWELPEKKKEVAPAPTPEPQPEPEDAEYLTPEEAADLIPERSVEDILQARAERVADIEDLTDIRDISEIVSAEDLAELASIEDRTPRKGAGVKNTVSGKTRKTDAATAKKSSAETVKKTKKKPLHDLSELDYMEETPVRAKRRQLEELTALESSAFKPSKKAKKEIDFISSVVSSEEGLAARLANKAASGSAKRPARSSASGGNTRRSSVSDVPAAKRPKVSSAPVAPAEHQAKFVDAYQSSMGSGSKSTRTSTDSAKASSTKTTGRNSLRENRETNSAPKRRGYLVENRQADESAKRQNAHDTGYFPEDYDGYFNQNGNSVDEGLFSPNKNDGFLTPEQIADIIELERISKNE